MSRENDLLGLQVASDWLSEAAKYFLAIASMFSGDFDSAEKMLEALHKSKLLAHAGTITGVAKWRGLAQCMS